MTFYSCTRNVPPTRWCPRKKRHKNESAQNVIGNCQPIVCDICVTLSLKRKGSFLFSLWWIGRKDKKKKFENRNLHVDGHWTLAVPEWQGSICAPSQDGSDANGFLLQVEERGKKKKNLMPFSGLFIQWIYSSTTAALYTTHEVHLNIPAVFILLNICSAKTAQSLLIGEAAPRLSLFCLDTLQYILYIYIYIVCAYTSSYKRDKAAQSPLLFLMYYTHTHTH